MAIESYPNWIRGVDVFVGLITILIGFWIMLSPGFVEATLVITMALGLFLIGVVRFGKGVSISELTVTSRGLKILSGIGAIALSILSFIFSDLTVVFLITLLTFGIMLTGMSRIIVGYSEKGLPSWTRTMNIAGGGLVFLFGLFAAIFTDLGFFTLRLMLAIVFVVLGAIRIIAASKGEMT